MITLRFSPTLPSEATLSVAQGSQTAEWPLAATGGTATITVTRSPLQTAPERVFFDLELSGFNVPGAGANGYDAQVHDLVYEWDFGDTGASFDRPTQLLTEFRDANTAFGPFVAHVYHSPGTYQVQVTVRDLAQPSEPATTATFDITVADPDATFSGANTYYVSGDGVYTDAPPGSLTYTDLKAALEHAGDSGSPSRVMLRRDETFLWDNIFRRSGDFLHIVAGPGAGARPIIQDDVPNRTRPQFFIHRLTAAGSETTYQSIDFRGDWDSTAETGTPAAAMFLEATALGHVLVDDCDFDGLSFAIVEATPNDEAGHDARFVCMSNCVVTNWQNMAHFAVGGARFAHLGCEIACDPLARAGGPKDGAHNEHGCIRFQPAHAHKAVVDGCDFYSRTGWIENVPGIQTAQPCIRWNQNSKSNSVLNLQRSVFEGGYNQVTLTGANIDVVESVQNVLIDRCIFVGHHQTRSCILMDAAGVYARNCVAIFPNVPSQDAIFKTIAFAEIRDNDTEDAQLGPVRILSNSIINLLSDANSPNGDGSVQIMLDDDGFPDLVVNNNVLFQPNIGTPQIADGPLANYNPRVTLFTPREPGYVSEVVTTLQTQHATPTDTVFLPVPQAGAGAVGAATNGELSLLDLYGGNRPTPPSQGALEVSTSAPNPEEGLTLSSTVAVGSTNSDLEAAKGETCVLAFDVTGLSTEDGILFNAGAAGHGCDIVVKDGLLQITTGIGSVVTGTSGTCHYSGPVVANATYVIEINPQGGQNRVWTNGVEMGIITGANDTNQPFWAGSEPSGWLHPSGWGATATLGSGLPVSDYTSISALRLYRDQTSSL